MPRRSVVSIKDGDIFLNGQPTYPGRVWQGKRIEGLLLNSRMVHATFDDLNPQTRSMWDYPDGKWDPDRNTQEFLDQLPLWREHGLISFTLNLQGGSPKANAWSHEQPWHNSAFTEEGGLRPAYMARLERILERADALGMVPILGFFYFRQDLRLRSEAAVVAAVDAATDWLLDRGYANVLIEINNECNIYYTHPILKPARVHELIERVQRRSEGKLDTPAGRLLVSASYSGGVVVKPNVARTADFILMHGNGVEGPDVIRHMVQAARESEGYRGQPIVFNEDDHFQFDQPDNHMLAAVGEHASWGYHDFRMPGEDFTDGHQGVPVDWRISSDRKRGFFGLLKQITGGM